MNRETGKSSAKRKITNIKRNVTQKIKVELILIKASIDR